MKGAYVYASLSEQILTTFRQFLADTIAKVPDGHLSHFRRHICDELNRDMPLLVNRVLRIKQNLADSYMPPTSFEKYDDLMFGEERRVVFKFCNYVNRDIEIVSRAVVEIAGDAADLTWCAFEMFMIRDKKMLPCGARVVRTFHLDENC